MENYINKCCYKSIMSNNYCIFLYSHSDYSDVWDLTFGQIYKYINLDDVTIIFCIDQLNNYKIDDRIKVVYYDNNLIYSDRILTNIIDLNYEYILFLHEDWVVINNFSNEYTLKLIEFMNKNDILHIRSYKNYGKSTITPNIFHNDVNICNIPSDSGNFISLQPGLWEKNVFIELYSFKANKPNILETNSNNHFKSKYKDRCYYETDSVIAEDSKMFPHIHTIGYGRWAMCNDTYNNLELLLIQYNIDKNTRGYYNRKKGDDVKPHKQLVN
tara:strand:- start:1627 stop:2439 length:813 start_codon:yes stop_codon:yes gene_type:complete